LIEQLAVPARAVGGFVEMSIDTFVKIFRRPFQFREFLEQTWMVAKVSLVPTLLVAIPFTVLVVFTLNILLREIGAADLSGASTAFGTITQLGPVVTVLVVAGAVSQANEVGVGVLSAQRNSGSSWCI
jgi:phospholipid/cholesterol/gamma-HCH transport system permease protein